MRKIQIIGEEEIQNLYKIYKYEHPTTLEVLYVGCTTNVRRRHSQHSTNTKSPLHQTIAELGRSPGENVLSALSPGLEPIITIICGADTKEDALELEKHWIQALTPKLNRAHNGDFFDKVEELEDSIKWATIHAEKWGLPFEEVKACYSLWNEVWQCGITYSIVEDTMIALEKVFKCELPLNPLEVLKIAAYVAGITKDLDVERTPNDLRSIAGSEAK